VLRAVQRGRTTLIENHSEPEAALLDITDYLIMRAYTAAQGSMLLCLTVTLAIRLHHSLSNRHSFLSHSQCLASIRFIK
jgi:hypothetical protein